MKKIRILLIFLATILCFNLGVSEINAAKKVLATCTYKPSDTKINGILAGITLTTTVNSDGTLSNTKIKLKDWSKSPKGGDMISDTGVFLQFDSKTFSKNGNFYKEFKKVNGCPRVQFIWDLSYNQFKINVGASSVTSNFPNDIPEPITTNKGENVEEEELICEKEIGIDANRNMVTVQFKKQGNKKFFVVKELTGTYEADIDGIAVGSPVSYRINDSDKSIYWDKSKCNGAKLYAKAINGDANNIIFQTTKPPVEENGGEYEENENKGDYDDIIDIDGGKDNPEQYDDVCALIEGETLNQIQDIVGYVQIGTIFLILVLGMLDFTGAIGSGEDNAFKKAGSKFLKRLIAGALVFLIPAILGIILNLVSIANGCEASIFK